jgi:hypothetical protein
MAGGLAGDAAIGGVATPLLLVLAAAALTVAGATLRWGRRRGRHLAGGVAQRRRRREVSVGTYRLAHMTAFRYSPSRDALVLRGVGHRIGPVLRLPRALAPLPPPLQVSATNAALTVDLACLPLPAPQHGRVWQLTAVDVDAGFTWAELTRPRGAPPRVEQAHALLERIAAQLAGRGLRLAAVVVQPGSTHRHTLVAAAEAAGVELRFGLTADDGRPLAAQRHERLVAEHWEQALATPGAPPLDALERLLQQWVDAGNMARIGPSGDQPSPAQRLVGTSSRPADPTARDPMRPSPYGG